MSVIRVLEQTVVDRIAAGEVVERPESVVKELVENALDAGATRIDVRVEEGGRRLVEVVDDGHGMGRDDASLAFVQHATSKIVSVGDLDHIGTHGFRGEALASIASVSRVEMVTASGPDGGLRVRVEGGGEPDVRPVAAPRGTRVRVQDLFFNTPARRKHLRAAGAEFGRIAAVVEEFALLRPDVHLSLSHDGRERLLAPPVAELVERVHQVLGADVAERWIPVHGGGRVTVRGGVTDPLHSRRDRRRIHLFVNGRAIQDARLAHAVSGAYGALLDHGRHPVAALFIELPVEDVDVNVHPRKAEVRFVDPGRVYGAIRKAVQQALAHHTTVPGIGEAARRERVAPVPDPAFREALQEGEANASATPSLPLRDWTVAESAGDMAGRRTRPAPVQQARPISGTRGAIQPLAQYANTYILAADDDGLLIIDQHVAHERILYELILVARQDRRLPVQRLLVPETIDLSASEEEAAEAWAETLADFGFEIEPFGGRTWAVRAVPELLGSRSAADVVRSLLETLAEQGDAAEVERMRQEIAASIACHSAVRANQPLTAEVMTHLVAELTRCEAPTRCPHGRPVLIRLEHGDIERHLHRH